MQTLALRQQLGNITPSEVAEVSSQVGGGQYLIRSVSDGEKPSKLKAYNLPLIGAFGGAGGAMALIGLAKGYNFTWLIGAAIPLATILLYNSSRQPEELLQNGYRYILAKRQATVEMQSQALAFETSEAA